MSFPITLSAMRKRATVTTMNMGMYFNPDFALPLLIVDIITVVKTEVIIKEIIAKILKSLYFIPDDEKLSANPDVAPANPESLKELPRLLITWINIPASANSIGAAITVEKVMKIM